MLHSKQWHYSLHRDFQNCYSTRRSLTRFFKAPIPESIQNPILHTEDRELFEYYNSTHRRQGDLLEMHPCVLQGIQGNSSCSRDIQDIPVIHDLPAFQAILQCSSISRESTPFQHSPIRMHILHILQFLQFDWFPQKLHRVPVGQLQTLQTLHSKKGRCCDIGQDVKMTYFLE